MPFTVQTQGRTNNLFFYARDWTGVTSYGNLTVPEWWLFYYFGAIDLSETSMDASGNDTLLDDYNNGIDPNIISFSVNATSRYFNTRSATVQFNVSAGAPFYMAALVDDTNWADATWQPYNSNPAINLGGVEGWHSVWVGLKGLPPNAQQTWEQIRLKLILTAPVLIITNPIAGIVTQPMIEIQGFCADPLASLTFDLSNAAGAVTNQPAFVLSQHYDTNAGGFTTNTFQAFDVPLTNGANVVTFHATDMAGNVTTTHFTHTLDYSGKTNPPAIQVYWPQNGDQVSGTEFTLRGSLDDFTASLTAQIVDSSGGTNTLQGLVERNGLFWVENAPLLAGTNYVTLTAMDAVGNISTTNLTINCVSAGPTIDDFSDELGGDPRNIIPIITGTVALTNYTLWVNGIQATHNGNGTWEAYSVPVGPGGTAVVEARAIPNSDNGGNGTGTTPPSDGTPGNPTADDSMAAQTQVDQPPTCYMQEYQYGCNYTLNLAGSDCMEYQWIQNAQLDYVDPNGGAANSYVSELVNDCPEFVGESSYNATRNYSWPCGQCPMTVVYSDSYGRTGTDQTDDFALVFGWLQDDSIFGDSMAMAEWNMSQHEAAQLEGTADETVSICSQMTLQTGGKGVAGRQNVFEIDVSAWSWQPCGVLNGDDVPGWDVCSTLVPPTEISDLGQTANTNGQIFTVLPDNTTMDITPQTPAQCYTYLVSPTKYKSYFQVYDRMPNVPAYPGVEIHNGTDFGHAWWGFWTAAPATTLIPTNLLPFLNTTAGFYALTHPPLYNLQESVPGRVRVPDGYTYPTVQPRWQIGFNQLISGLQFTQSQASSPPMYNFLTHNCVDEVIQVGAAAGVSVPDYKGGGPWSNPEWFGVGLPPSQ
jgi:hypothetical protein